MVFLSCIDGVICRVSFRDFSEEEASEFSGSGPDPDCRASTCRRELVADDPVIIDIESDGARRVNGEFDPMPGVVKIRRDETGVLVRWVVSQTVAALPSIELDRRAGQRLCPRCSVQCTEANTEATRYPRSVGDVADTTGQSQRTHGGPG